MAKTKNIKTFWQKVDTRATCWEWTGSKNVWGYGQFYGDKRESAAHRLSWVMANGDIPEGLCVLHRCDNPACVRPSHLFLGTFGDNARDRAAKGRGARLRGELSGKAKLNNETVRRLRSEYTGEYGQISKMARELGLSYNTVAYAIKKVTWTNA